MNHKILLALILILSCCSSRPSDTVSSDSVSSDKGGTREVTDNTDNSNDLNRPTNKIQTDSMSVGQRNFWNSMIHRDFDNDSLLLNLPDLKQMIRMFVSKSKKVKEKQYGAGDYFGKYRVYADKFDTLIIDKGDGGDYGFGNTIYLKRKDSIVLYRDYDFNSLASNSGQFEEIVEQLVIFKNGVMDSKQRKMTNYCVQTPT